VTPPRRVLFAGISGAGKTTMARRHGPRSQATVERTERFPGVIVVHLHTARQARHWLANA
jgi:adenylylsulfate kinase-like enzyme